MKKILNALFLTLLAVFTFSSCSDVPAPYDILGEGDVPGLTGDGTKENPYNIEAAQQKQDGSIAWVQGYIVGAIENVYDDKGEFAGNKASFTAPFTITSNVLIAESPDETNESKCLPVKIKNGSELSTALNLKDHPENKGGVLLIQGELSAGFGKAALINTTAAVFNNKEIGEEQGGEDLDPDNPLGLDTSVAPLVDLSNNFDDVQHQADYSKAGWINKAVKGNRIWQGAIYDPQKYLAASTYGVNSGETAEYWFVTPYFTVNADKQFTFKATVNKYSETMSLKVFFLQMKDGKMERHEISVTGIPTSGTYQWTSDLKVDLSTYAGQNGFVGFQYVALRGAEVQTYGIDDIVYGEGGGTETPGGDDPFGLDDSNPKTTFEADFEDITEQNKNYTLEGWTNKAIQAANLWQTATYSSDKYIKATPYNIAADATMEAWFITPAFIVNSANKFTFDCAGANWKDDMVLKVFFLTKSADGTVVKNEVVANQIPTSGTNFEWVRGINIDLSDYNDKIGFVGFQYTVVSTGVNKSLPTYQIDNVKYVTGESGGTDPEQPGDKVYTSSITLPEGTDPDANKASGGKVVIGGQKYSILKLGTSKAFGSWNSPMLQAGASKLSFFAVGWTGKTGQLTVVIENGGTFEGGATSKVIALDGKTAGAADNPPFTIAPADTDFYQYAMSGVTAATTIKFTTEGATSDKRAIIFGINIK